METTKPTDGYGSSDVEDYANGIGIINSNYIAEDYPFSSWETFRPALLESLQTEFFGEEYPKYEAASETTTNLKIIKSLLNTSTPQDILDDIIDMTINEGQRYAGEVILGNTDIIDFLLKKGAEFPWSLVFSLPEDEEFEDNYVGLQHRATLIDMYSALKPEIPAEIINADPYDGDCYDENIPNICAGFIKANSKYVQVHRN